MNHFGKPGAHQLVDELRVLADDAPEVDQRRILSDAADTIEAANRYFGAVESALV